MEIHTHTIMMDTYIIMNSELIINGYIYIYIYTHTHTHTLTQL